MRAAEPKTVAAASSTGQRLRASRWMRLWNRSTATGNGDQLNHSLVGLSASGSAAPTIAASIDSRLSGGDAAANAPIAARLISPSGTATRRNSRSLRQLPQCGTASTTKCEATPAAKAAAGRRVSAPISAPDKTWLVSSTLRHLLPPPYAAARRAERLGVD